MNEKEKILIVEDETIVAKDLQQKLTKLGYDVPTTLSTGEEAIQKAEQLDLDLVLMDIKLSEEMDGIQAAEKIHNQFEIPIIFLTAYGDKKTLERAKKTEPYGYVMKPFNIKELHSNIQVALHKNKMEKKVKQHHHWMLNTLQHMGNAVITTDENQKITFVNAAAEKLIGMGKKELINQNADTCIQLVNGETNENISLFSVLTNNEKDKIHSNEIQDIILTSKDGRKMIVDINASSIKRLDGSIDGFALNIQDVTEQREGYNVLQKVSKELKRRVEKRTEQLRETIESLEKQINERKKAEEKAKEMQTSVENIINSTSDIIIALDSCNRVEYWNSSAQKLTGYKKKDVYGRYITKLPFVNDSKKLKDIIDTVHESKEVISQKLVMITKDYSKRILNLSCAPLHTNGEKKGIVFVGKDITYDWESHHNLLVGHSYIIAEKNKRSSLDLFSNLIFSDFNGIYITRSHPKKLKENLSTDKIKPIFIRKNPLNKYQTISTPAEFLDEIKTYATTNEKTVLFVDGLHYFLTTTTFDEVLTTLYDINEIISDSSIMLLLYFDPQLFASDELAILQNEFEPLPSKKVEDIKIKDELFDILTFIEKENKKNALVSLKKIMSQFNIVYYTASKRVKQLVDEGLVFTKKYGKSRVVHLTEKAKTLLTHR
ncbi:MAG: PAS domain S-box protein, partial [Thermoplasmatota archaeon]